MNDDFKDSKIKYPAEFIMPPNLIKKKIGSGGLYEDIIEQAELLVREFADDFMADSHDHINQLGQGIQTIAQKPVSQRGQKDIETLIYPAFQLQSNAPLFGYNLIGTMSALLREFLEAISTLDNKAMQIVTVFHVTLSLILKSRMSGDGGDKGKILMAALETACKRYER